LKNEILDKQRELESLIDSTSSTVESSTPVCNTTDVNDTLIKLKTRWAALLTDVTRRTAQLTDISLVSGTYRAQLSPMLTWIALTRDKLSWLPPLDDNAPDRAGEAPDGSGEGPVLSAERHLDETRNLVNDMTRQAPERDALIRIATVLIDSCRTDQAVVQGELDQVEEAWNLVQTGTKVYLIQVKQQEVHWTPYCVRSSLGLSFYVPETPCFLGVLKVSILQVSILQISIFQVSIYCILQVSILQVSIYCILQVSIFQVSIYCILQVSILQVCILQVSILQVS